MWGKELLEELIGYLAMDLLLIGFLTCLGLRKSLLLWLTKAKRRTLLIDSSELDTSRSEASATLNLVI